MAEQEYFADDRGIIPDYIKKMTPEQLRAEIVRLEQEIKAQKQAKEKKAG